MSEAKIKIMDKQDTPAGLPINYSCFGEILKNGTVLLALSTSEKTVEITCTREWALGFARDIMKALDEKSETESQIRVSSSPFLPGQAVSADT